MSDKFRIWRERDHDNPRNWGFWRLDYPSKFAVEVGDETGVLCVTFDEIVAEFIAAELRLCPMCGKGAVEHPDWGWECQACGCSDVAVGCTRPGSDRECTCAMTETSQYRCAVHGAKAPAL